MLFSMLNHLRNIGCVLVLVMFFFACEEQHEHTAPAIHARDSVPVMVSYGVNTLVSDSGVAKYRIVTEEWEINTNLRPSRWIFNKGVFLEQFDEKFHVQSFAKDDFDSSNNGSSDANLTDSARRAQDSIAKYQHPIATPQRKNTSIPLMH